MFLGIEIGGTKLQLGVGDGQHADLVALERYDVSPNAGADGILAQIRGSAQGLFERFDIGRVGIGFGGPVDSARGRVTTSHQIQGWTDFPLVDWIRDQLGRPAALGNDCDCAALAEAQYGAGRGHRTVLYVTVGTGVGGGLVIDGLVHGTDRPSAAEIGHLRPGLLATDPGHTVESLASGWGIATTARACLLDEPLRVQDRLLSAGRPVLGEKDRSDLMGRCDGNTKLLTTVMIGEAAAAGSGGAREILRTATDTLGWAIAQVAAIVAPNVVVIGGGVSLLGDELFLNPVRDAVGRHIFPPLAGSFELAGPQLGEAVVLHGAAALAALGHDQRVG